jgi:hypothetical protein
MSESNAPSPKSSGLDLTPELIRGLGAAAGLDLSEDRVAGLIAQVRPYFSALSVLDTLELRDTEPAGEFRLVGKGVAR